LQELTGNTNAQKLLEFLPFRIDPLKNDELWKMSRRKPDNVDKIRLTASAITR